MICALPSGIRRRRTISATVPTLWICSGCTSSISASRWARGTTSFGKTTASRRGTTGRSLGYAPVGGVVFVSSVILVLCFFSRFGWRGSRLTEYAYLEARAFVSVAFWSRIGSVRGLVIFGREVRQLAHQ